MVERRSQIGRPSLNAGPSPATAESLSHPADGVRRATGVGVPTEGIATYRIHPEAFADEILRAYAAEMLGVTEARVKARGVP